MGGGNQIYGGGLSNDYGYQCDVCGMSWSPTIYGRHCPNECVAPYSTRQQPPVPPALQKLLDKQQSLENHYWCINGYQHNAIASLKKYRAKANRQNAANKARAEIFRLDKQRHDLYHQLLNIHADVVKMSEELHWKIDKEPDWVHRPPQPVESWANLS